MKVLLISILFISPVLLFAQSNTPNIRSCRGTGTIYYIDGVRFSPPQKIKINVPLVDPFKYQAYTFDQKKLMSLPQRNVNAVAGTISGVDSRNGQTPNIKGARQEGTAYYVDGVRVYF